MARYLVLPLATLILLLAGCSEVPVTGRQQIVFVSDEAATEMGQQAYREILSTQGVVEDPEMTAAVQRVGRRLAKASGQRDQDWQFNVINDDTPNAFALPGGYVGVHRGLFNVVRNDDELAAVMAHEIGHVAARHPAERLSREALVQTGLAALGGASASTAQIAAAAATLGLVLPFSREQETEADAIGLQYMAQAGYDPRAAVEVWRRFEQLESSTQGVPQFLSTHPTAGNRIRNLQALLPEATAIYERKRRG